MKGDSKKFYEFYRQMDYEGGIEGIIRHGFDSTGFSALDILLEKMDSILQEIDSKMGVIFDEYKEELDAMEEDEG